MKQQSLQAWADQLKAWDWFKTHPSTFRRMTERIELGDRVWSAVCAQERTGAL